MNPIKSECVFFCKIFNAAEELGKCRDYIEDAQNRKSKGKDKIKGRIGSRDRDERNDCRKLNKRYPKVFFECGSGVRQGRRQQCY